MLTPFEPCITKVSPVGVFTSLSFYPFIANESPLGFFTVIFTSFSISCLLGEASFGLIVPDIASVASWIELLKLIGTKSYFTGYGLVVSCYADSAFLVSASCSLYCLRYCISSLYSKSAKYLSLTSTFCFTSAGLGLYSHLAFSFKFSFNV